MPQRHEVQLPNARGRVEIVEPGGFSAMRVEADGQLIAKNGWFSTVYPIPSADGGTIELDVKPDPFRGGIVIKGGGLDQRLGEAIPLWLGILAFLPFVLAGVGGALGGLCGALGWIANQKIARAALPLPIRVVIMFGVTFAAGIVWFVLAMVVQTVFLS